MESIAYPGGRVGILLFHSLGGTPLEMKYLAQNLSREGYSVRCPVIPGMTNGTDVLKLSRWQDWYDAALAEFEDLRQSCDVVFVGGLSAGSMLALRLAAERHDEVAGQLVMAPTFWANGWAIPFSFNFFRLVWQNWFARLFNFAQREPFGIKDDRLRRFMIEAFKSEGREMAEVYSRHGRMVLQFRFLADNVKRRLGTLTKPTIVMHPREDDQSDLSNALKLMRMVNGPVDAVILDDCYHMIPLDRQRDVVLDRLSDFVGRQLAGMGLDQQGEPLVRTREAAAVKTTSVTASGSKKAAQDRVNLAANTIAAE